ncbi:IS3 family transposase [Actinomyces sp.]
MSGPFATHQGWLRTTTIAQRQRGPARRPRRPRGAKSAAYPRTSGIGSRRIGKRSPRRARLAHARSGARRADTRAARGADEQVFGHLKDEFFRGQDWPTFESFKADLATYITHWNTTRRHVKLKGLTPAEYRDQALREAA